MAVFNLTGFKAEAEVLGAIQRVTFEDGTLSIHGIDLAQAKKALDMLSVGLQAVSFDGEEEGHTYAEPQSKPETEPAAETEPAKVEKPKDKDKNKDKDKGKGKGKDKDKGKDKGRSKPKDEQKADAEPEKKSDDKGNGSSDPADDIVAAMSDMVRLSDVVRELIDRGTPAEKDAIVEKCAELRDKVPALKRVPEKNIPGRVDRVLTTLKADEDGEEATA